MESPVRARRFRFGLFEADLTTCELRKNGLKIKLQEQPFQILRLLLEHRGELVTREELRKELWPTDTFVDFDVGLNVAIKKLRDAIGDSAAPQANRRRAAATSAQAFSGLPAHAQNNRAVAPLQFVGGKFTPLSKPLKTREQAEKVRLKHPERERKTIGVGMIRTKA